MHNAQMLVVIYNTKLDLNWTLYRPELFIGCSSFHKTILFHNFINSNFLFQVYGDLVVTLTKEQSYAHYKVKQTHFMESH